MNKIEFRKIGSLELHPDNVAIFGLPTDEVNYEEIRDDIKIRGLQEPLIILDSGRILSGHIRYAGVWWVYEQDGLTKNQIEDQVIAVRVHEDFESKEEELKYLMAANEKRRQLDPRRIASVFDRLVRVLVLELEKGKSKDAIKGLADRLGISHKLAKNYCTIFSSKVVPEEVKEKVNSKSLSPSAVLEAIKFAEDSAQRERRAPSMADVDAYIKTPRAKTSLADTVRQITKGTTPISTIASSPTPKPDLKPTTIEVTPDPRPEPVKVSTPDPVVEEVKVLNTHTRHCCLEHGCKYSDPTCPVVNGEQKQEGPCETCGLISEEYFEQGDVAEDQGIVLDDSDCEEYYPDSDKISTAHSLLKEALQTVILDASVTSELLGIHTELTAYLQAMGLLNTVEPEKLVVETPITTEAQETQTTSSSEVDLKDLDSLLEPTPETKTNSPIDLHTEIPQPPIKVDPISPAAKEDSQKTLQPTSAEPEEQLVSPLMEEPKEKTPVQAKVEVHTEDPDADLVTSVIDDFLEEIEKAGVAINS
jgi:hypothetical protein